MKYLAKFVVPVTFKLSHEQRLAAFAAVNTAFLGRPQLSSLTEEVTREHESAAHKAGRSYTVKIEVGLCPDGALKFIRKV